MRLGKETVGVWKRYFQNVLNEGERSEVQGDEGGEEENGGNELLNKDVTRRSEAGFGHFEAESSPRE